MKIKDLLDNKTIDKNENYLVISSLLNMSIPEVKLNKDKEITTKEQKKYKKVIKKLEKGESVQYTLKKSNFYGLEYEVDKNVLIPRPETEVLVEETNKLIKEKFKNERINVLDIGTGSGIIAITLKYLDKTRNITATDISKKALKIAKNNSKKHNLDINYIKTNLYEGINKKFDVVISNPPYIDINSKDIEEKVKRNEPSIALYSKEKGLYHYKEILKDIKNIIKEDHIIAFEIGESQSKELKNIIKKYLPKDKTIIKKDYNNFDRYIFVISR